MALLPHDFCLFEKRFFMYQLKRKCYRLRYIDYLSVPTNPKNPRERSPEEFATPLLLLRNVSRGAFLQIIFLHQKVMHY